MTKFVKALITLSVLGSLSLMGYLGYTLSETSYKLGKVEEQVATLEEKNVTLMNDKGDLTTRSNVYKTQLDEANRQKEQIEKENQDLKLQLATKTAREEALAQAMVAEVPQQQPEAQPVVQDVVQAPAQPEAQSVAYTGQGSSAKEWIAQKESSGSYDATNGQYIGRYQLSASYLNGDYSPENQERVADQYVAGRYGSWENAQAFWLSNGWY